MKHYMKQLIIEDRNYLLFEVPEDSTGFFVNKVGCIRYQHNKNRESSPILPEQLGFYATDDNCKIIGTLSEQAEVYIEFLKKKNILSKKIVEKPNEPFKWDGSLSSNPVMVNAHRDMQRAWQEYLLLPDELLLVEKL